MLTGPMVSSREKICAIELGAKPAGKLFYFRYRSPPPPEFRPAYEEPRYGRRQIPRGCRGRRHGEPVDELERTVKPLNPHVFECTLRSSSAKLWAR